MTFHFLLYMASGGLVSVVKGLCHCLYVAVSNSFGPVDVPSRAAFDACAFGSVWHVAELIYYYALEAPLTALLDR